MRDEPLSPIDDIAGMFSVDDYMYFYSDYLNDEYNNLEAARVAHLLGMDQLARNRAGRSLRVLDLACGFGRIANRLALLGHRVTGVEFLSGFLDIARKQAEQVGVPVEYRQGDMRQLNFPAQFDRVVMVFNSFGYFSDEENSLVLRNIAAALKPGGKLGFDVAHRDGVLNDFHPHYVSEKGADLLINRFSFDIESGRLRNDRIVIRDGERKDRPFSIRLYSLTEMRTLLEQCGLVLEAVYAEWDGSPLEMDSPAMVVVAVKP